MHKPLSSLVLTWILMASSGCGRHSVAPDASLSGRQRLGCAVEGSCPFMDMARTCELRAVCATGDGRGYCTCGASNGLPDGGACSPCFINNPPAPNLQVSCTMDHDCAGGSCIYDRGCPGTAFCSEVTCDPAATQTYCGCDGRSFTAPCPSHPYAHFGACP